jgi:tRNA(Ser,Leu) C12 N-acetylase TAN1
MGLVLITSEFGKEEAARMEVLDCIFPLDPHAKFADHPFGGLLLLETTASADEASTAIRNCPTSLLFKITPVDTLVPSAIGEISGAVRGLVGSRQCRIKVRCRRRGRAISSCREVEVTIGEMLKAGGCSIDLEEPELVIQIDIIGELTTISVRPPSDFFTKRRG